MAFALLALLSVIPWLGAVSPALVVDDASFPPEPSRTLTLATLAGYFREDAWAAVRVSTGAYRPLARSLTRVESLLWETDPRGYHLSCVLTHVAVTLAVFALLSTVLRAVKRPDEDDRAADLAAWMSALIFGVHPIHTEAVDSIFNRSEVLATLGVTLALLVVARLAGSRPRVAWSLTAALYLLSLLSKESAATLPALAAVLLLLLRKPTDLRAAARVVAPAVTLAAPLALYLVMRSRALEHLTFDTTQGRGLAAPTAWPERLASTVTALREFWRMLVWPLPLRASYDDFTSRGVALAMVFHGALLGASIALRRRAPALLAGVAMVYLALLPVTRIVSHLGVVVTVAERYVYLPSVGFALALGALLLAVSRRGVEVTLVAGAALYLALAPMTWLRNDDWRSDLALWESETAAAPENPDAWKWLTAAYMNANRWDDVVRVCDERARQGVRHAPLLVHCAFAYDNRGRPADAERAITTAATLEASPVILTTLARRQVRAGRLDDARATYERALAAEVDPVRRDTTRGEMLLRTYPDRAAEAEAAYARALSVEPRYEAARVGLERARRARGAPPSR